MNLVAIGIGDADKAREFCRETGFPEEYLYSDDGGTYRDAGFRGGIKDTFFRSATLSSLTTRLSDESERKRLGKTLLPAYLKAWGRDGSKWLPPRFEYGIADGLEQGLQQGGQFVFEGDRLLFAHFDQGTAAHADIKLLLKRAGVIED